MEKKTDSLREAMMRLYQQDLERCKENEADHKKFCELDSHGVNQLSEKIEALPFDLRSILYLFYHFQYSESDIASILKQEQIKEKRLYAEKLLSEFMGLEGSLEDHSLLLACDQALKREMELEINE